MINIMELLEERTKYKFDGREDSWLDEILSKNMDEFTVIVPFSMFKFRYQLSLYGSLLDKYNIKCLIKTKSPYVVTNIWFNIITFTKSKVDKVVLSIYDEKPYKRVERNFTRGEIFVPTLKEDYLLYFDQINEALNKLDTERDDIYIIDNDNFDKNNLNPECYSEEALKIRNEIINNKTDFKTLGELAYINPDIYKETSDKMFGFDFSGKIHIRKVTERERHICKLKEHDIVLKRMSHSESFEYLYVTSEYVDKTVDVGVYTVIRMHDSDLVEYILFYLTDPKTLYYCMCNAAGNSIFHLSREMVEKLPVLIPTTEMINESKKLYALKNRTENIDVDSLNEAIRQLKSKKSSLEIRNIVNINIAEALSVVKTELAYQVIADDLKELDTCYKNGAYKASIILCGSLLEAILLDWLSEYEKSDNILDIAKYQNEKGEIRDLELSGIIYKLSKLIKPYWKEYQQATEIRKFRNLVHPKEYLNKKITITDEQCKEIIDDLKAIIDSRLDR